MIRGQQHVKRIMMVERNHSGHLHTTHDKTNVLFGGNLIPSEALRRTEKRFDISLLESLILHL